MRAVSPPPPRPTSLARALEPLTRALMVLVFLAAATSLTSCRRARATWHRHTAQGRAEAANARARVARGRTAYLRYCALCHGRQAQGYAADHANALGNQDFLSVASDEFLYKAILNGRPGTPMSAWGHTRGGPLSERTVNDVVAYLRSLARRPFLTVSERPSRGNHDRGQTLWNQRCVNCHGLRGQGSGVATSLTSPNFLRTVSDGFLRYTITHGRVGTPMLAFHLTPTELDDVVAFVRGEQHIPGPPPPPNYEPPPGLDRLIMNPGEPPPEFTLRDDRFVPADAVAQAMAQHKRMVILDARATSDWSAGHITGALPFPFYNIEQMAGQLPHDGTWILAYCACPHAASGHVVDELRRRNFPHAAVIDEGWGYWTSHNLPTAHAAIIPQ